MKKSFRITIFTFLFFMIFHPAFSQVLNNSQIINYDHWIYDSLYKLGKETKTLGFYENTMLSIGELKFYFEKIDEEKLSPSGKTVYNRIKDFLYSDSNLIPKLPFLFKDDAFKLDINLIANPELYYKSNDDIDWSFRYCYKDNFLSLPVIFGISDYFTIGTTPVFAKSNLGQQADDNFTNLPYKEDDFEFNFIKFSYGSSGLYFDNWGINLNINRQGLSIGNTKLGSIFYNKTFETDAYGQLNIFTKSFKYSGDIVQVDFSKYLFLHQIEFIFFNNFKLCALEGSQLCQPAELRFTIPFMFMHQFAAWEDYSRSRDVTPYAEENFCAYFGVLWEWAPVKNTRFYLIYAQNEMQTKSERNSYIGGLYPDSFGYQVGTDISIPAIYDGYWNIALEGVYASPYLYIKHTPKASLYRVRSDNLSTDKINSWVGFPFGPDCIAGHLSFGYEKPGKWNASLGYNLIAKGQNDFSMFKETSKTNPDKDQGDYDEDEDYSSYYPPVAFNLGKKDHDQAQKDALNMLPSGIIQYSNQIILSGGYTINKHLCLNGQALFSIVKNANHEEGNSQNGIELSFSLTYNLF